MAPAYKVYREDSDELEDESMMDAESSVDAETSVDDGSSTESEDETQDPSDTESEKEEESPWDNWVGAINAQFQERADTRMKELMADMSEEEGYKTARTELLPSMNKQLRKKLTKFALLAVQLKKDPIYIQIMRTARRARNSDRMDWEEAITHAVGKRQMLLNRVLNTWFFQGETDE
jgi:hypothetical protein